MEIYIYLFIAIVLIIILCKTFNRIILFEYEKGIKYFCGKYQKILEPGEYWFLPYFTTITRVDIRPRFLSITGQEVLSSDGVTLKVSIAAKYEISDPYTAVVKNFSYSEGAYLLLQLSAREIIGNSKIDELLENRSSFSQKFMELTGKNFEETGLKLLSVDLKDIMFPGEIKNIFAQVVKAQKEGLAILEKARGETAALRNLTNAAKLIEENPHLMQLRLLQALGQSSGNTFLLNVTPGNVVPVKEVKSEK